VGIVWLECVELLAQRNCSVGEAIVRASDDHLYLLRFLSGVDTRLRVNECIGSWAAERVGLPVLPVRLIRASPDIVPVPRGGTGGQAAGLYVGVRIPKPPVQLFGYLPAALLPGVSNAAALPGIWLFDAWTSRPRRTLFWTRWPNSSESRAKMLLQSECFQGSAWRLEAIPPPPREVQGSRLSLERFEPYLSRIESLSVGDIEELKCGIPEQWLNGEDGIEALVAALHSRAGEIRSLASVMVARAASRA